MRDNKITSLINSFDARGLFVEFYHLINTPSTTIANVVTHDGVSHTCKYQLGSWHII